MACADRWFRGALGIARGPAAAASSAKEEAAEAPGYAELIEGALAELETAEAGAHIAAHVAEALSMCSRPGEAVACLSHSLDALSLLADFPRVRCLRGRGAAARHRFRAAWGSPLPPPTPFTVSTSCPDFRLVHMVS